MTPWSTQIGGEGTEINDVITDTSGNIYITGTNTFASDSDAFVAKLDNNSNIQWNYPFVGMTYDEGYSLVVDANGNIYMAGATQTYFDTNGEGIDDILIAKLSSSGVLQWKQTYGNTSEYDYGNGIALDGLGNLYIAGDSWLSWGSPLRPHTPNQYDPFVARIDPNNGTLIWNTFLGEALNGHGLAIATDSIGNLYVTGRSFIPNSLSNAFVAKLDGSGASLWFQTFGSAGANDSGYDIAADGNGNVYVTGESWASWGSPLRAFTGSADAFVLKLSNNGSMQWNTFAGGIGFDLAYGIDVDADANIYISGPSTDVWGTPFDSGTGLPQEVFTAKLDNNGIISWNTFIKGESWWTTGGHPNRIVVRDGSIYVATHTNTTYSNLAFITKINDSAYDCSGTTLSPIAQAVKDEVGDQEFCGNRYERLITLPPGLDAFQEFATLAESATHEIDFVTMGWDSYESDRGDSPGRIFLEGIKTLYERIKANPGDHLIRVRILLGLKYYTFTGREDQRAKVMKELSDLGIEPEAPNWKIEVAAYRNARQTLPLPGSETFGTHSHVKLMIVDGKHAIAAGYNMHYNYLENNPDEDKIPVHDMGVEVSGPIAYRSLRVFDELWSGAYLCDHLENNLCVEGNQITNIEHDASLSVVSGEGNINAFSLFRDDTQKEADDAIAAAVDAANSRLNIIQNRFVNETYINPPQYVRSILNAIQNENVYVKLLVSSGNGTISEKADQLWPNLSGVCRLRNQILNLNGGALYLPRFSARFSTYNNPIHTKALSIDDSFVIVGSQNWDSSAWGNDMDIFGDLAEYSLGIDSMQAATDFQNKFTEEWNASQPPSCLDDGLSGTAFQNAIDQASPGTAIFLPAGVYTASVTIDKPLVLVGAGSNQTIIHMQGSQPAFHITSSEVTIMNMKISGGSGYGIELIDSSSHSLKNIEINRVVFENNTQGGVLAQGLISGSPMNYDIENNTFVGGADGVTINMSETQTMTSVIKNNIFSGQSSAPIHVLSANDSRVEYSFNLFDDCGLGTCDTNWHSGNINVASSVHDNVFNLNPLFANPQKGAYQLSAGSPAIDAGDPNMISNLFQDGNNDGIIRVDLGAFEYAPVANVAPVVNAGNDQSVDLGNSITINATYSDADNSEGHSAKINWGDGTIEDVAVNMTGAGTGSITDEHLYIASGNYTVEVCVTDSLGSVGCDTTNITVQNPIPKIIGITTGYYHACALTESGGVKCWGDNTYGQLGDGTTTQHSTPVNVSGLTSGVVAISAGSYHTCAVLSTGGLRCWGMNNAGQLGDNSYNTRLIPVNVSGLSSGVAAVTAGDYHTCALTTTGGVKCWGSNSNGQLGDNSTSTRLVPVNVSGLTSGVSKITAGGAHSCAVTTSGAAKCWGSNMQGEIGDNTTRDKKTPTNVSGLTTGVATIAAGASHTCAVLTSGGAKCWGNNIGFQLGDGTSVGRRLTPVNVSGLTSGVSKITAGGAHTCAVTTNGGAKCWGYNADGEIGNGTTGYQQTPVDVTGLTSGTSTISAGSFFTCAVTTNGLAKCWGHNAFGQLGNGIYGGYFVLPVDVNFGGGG